MSCWVDGMPQSPHNAEVEAFHPLVNGFTKLRYLQVEDGSGVGANSLGIMLREGCGVLVDYTTVTLSFKQGMERGLREGAKNVGESYEFGQGAEENEEKAAQL